jgi:SAM-dependent methyltransferase
MDPQLYRRFFEIEDWFWWCVGTRRVFLQLITSTGIRGRALDVGCGTGAILKEFGAGWGVVAGCDHSPLALSFSQARGLHDLVRCNGTELPFASGSLDLVMAIDVIEHIDDEGCMREMVRICRSGGYVLVHVPAFDILWTDKDDVNHHLRRYRRRDLVQLVERHGLSVETVFHLNVLLFPVALLRALGQKVRWGFRPRPAVSAATIDHLYRLPPSLNRMMTGLMTLEHWLFGRAAPPFGMSLVCLARKPEQLIERRASRRQQPLQVDARPEE